MAQLHTAELHLHLYPKDTIAFTELKLSPRHRSIMLVKTVESVGVLASILHITVVVVLFVVAGFCACH